MKIVKKKIKDLIYAEYNPRKLSEEQERHLRDSMKRFEQVQPVIVNSNPERKNIIVGGHQRTKVWESLGHETIECIEIDLSPDKEKELNIRLNKNTGSFDQEMLIEHFDTEDLIEWGFDGEEIGDWGLDVDGLGEDFTLADGEKPPFQQMTFTLADEQAEQLKNALEDVKGMEEYKYCETFGNENSNGNAIYFLVTEWAGQRI